ncbi:Nlrc3, partial [Symbiodinium pilosum]
ERAGTKDGMPALVGHEEVQNQDAWVEIKVVSHCWESKQHPDPYGHQLRQLVEKLQQPYAYDDCSEVAAFGRAMANMHVLYSHEEAETVFLDELTPTDIIEAHKDSLIAVYDEESRMVKQIPASKLEANRTPYESRGWCSAEVQWSCTKDAVSNSAIPLPPHVFAERFADGKGTGLKFTLRSDASEVLRLQAQVFNEKIPKCKLFGINLHVVREDDLSDLAVALPAFESLECIIFCMYKDERPKNRRSVEDRRSVLLSAFAKALAQVTCPNLREIQFHSAPRVHANRYQDLGSTESLILDQPPSDAGVLHRALLQACDKSDANCVESGEVRLSEYASGAAKQLA